MLLLQLNHLAYIFSIHVMSMKKCHVSIALSDTVCPFTQCSEKNKALILGYPLSPLYAVQQTKLKFSLALK